MHRNNAPREVLMKTVLRPLNTTRPVNNPHPKTIVHYARPMLRFSKSAQSTVKKPYQQRTAFTNITFRPRPVNTDRPTPVNTVRPRPVNTARPNSAVVNAVMTNKGHPQQVQEDQGYVDSGCSRHMTGNMSYLSDFKEFNGGYVTFWGRSKWWQNHCVSQMCDRKNNILFTYIEYLVLSPNFKLPDENQILLRVPRRNNMDSVDMKNIVPKESLTCLVAKATLDESILWHKRLGHINFKNINKLVKDNLVRGIKREFSIARTPQQNSVTERRNRTLIEAARTMLADYKLPTTYWAKAVNIVCYVQNRVLVVKPHNKTPYNLFRGRSPALSFMKPFRCHVTILNTLDHLGTFDGKADEGYFVGYSMHSKAFRVYNIRTRRVEENLHIEFLENKPIVAGARPKWLFDIDMLTESMNYVPIIAGDMRNINTTYQVPSTPNTRIHKDHLLDLVIGDVQSSVLTRKIIKTTQEQGFISTVYEEKTHEDLNTCLFACFLSKIELTRVAKSLIGPAWVEAMQEELLLFKLQKVWILVDLPKAQIEAIRLFLAYGSFMSFMVYQMDVKSAFFYERIEEEVYVCQPLGFEDPNHPNKVYKVVKALYGLHQAPRAWYETLAKYLLDNRFHRGKIDQTLFIKRNNGDILFVQMSSMGELTFFLGLQVKQTEDRIFISQVKYVTDVLRKFNLSDVKTASTQVDTKKPLVKDADCVDVDVHLYRSMIGSLMCLTTSRPDIMYATSAKVKTVNKDVQLQALVDGKRVIVNEASIIRDLRLDDAEAPEEVGEIQTDTQDTPILTQPSSSQPQRKRKSRRKQRKEIEEEEGLRDQEDASKQGRMAEIDADEDLSLINETTQDQGRMNEEDLFGVHDLDGYEVILDITAGQNVEQDATFAENKVSTDGDEVVTTADDAKITTAATTLQISKDDVTLAQTLTEIKAAKPRARGVIVQEPSEFRTTSSLQSSQLPQAKDKGKGNMVEHEKPLKKKDTISIDEEIARKLKAQLKVEMEEGERIAREKVEANIDVVEQWDKVQAKIDADIELAQKLQTKEQEQLTDAEKAKLFMEFLEKRRKFFARKRKIKKRNIPPTKAQQRNLMCTYFKNMDGWKLKNLKKKSFDEIQKLFDLAMKKRLEKEDDSVELKRCWEIVPEDDDDVTIKATPLSSKSPTIVDYKIYKEGKKSYFRIIRCTHLQANILHQMGKDVRLQVDYKVEMAYDILRLIKRQINEGYIPT
uniref:Integrase catalytic domain-containing protein n=1 Tax=Tanacetum cinerariifolium TaxID=118510 RepID=A0A6L2JZB0_TANCI|nr:hypothetical protein [Tanacetum cinerariifolium]